MEDHAAHSQSILSVPNRITIFCGKFLVLFGGGVFALISLVLLFSILVAIQGLIPYTPYVMLLETIIVLAFGNIILYIFHLFIGFKFGLGLSLFLGVFESLQVIMYSNIVLAGVWKYIPFAWAIDLSRYVLDDKLSLHKNEVFIMGLITIIAFIAVIFGFHNGKEGKTMIKKMILLVVAILLMGASMTGCSVLEKGIDEYSKDKEECVLNTDNVTQFTYKGDSFTILDDTLSNSELGEWVGYIRKLAVIDSNGKILLQQDTEKATFKTLADIAGSEPDAAYIIPFLNVYTVKDGNTQELIVDANGGYHKAILNSFVTDKDTIFRYNQKTEATAEGEFTINTQNCTQLLMRG